MTILLCSAHGYDSMLIGGSNRILPMANFPWGPGLAGADLDNPATKFRIKAVPEVYTVFDDLSYEISKLNLKVPQTPPPKKK